MGFHGWCLLLMLVLVELGCSLGASENPFSPRASLLRHWNRLFPSEQMPGILLSRASPLNATQVAVFSRYIDDHTLPAHIRSFCSAANLFCDVKLPANVTHDVSGDADFASYNNKQFQRYQADAIDGNDKFKNYSVGENIARDIFVRYGEDGSSGFQDFTNYVVDTNVAGSDFAKYNSHGNFMMGDFTSYGLRSNVQRHDFATYSSDSSGDSQSFSSYSEESNVVKNDFKTYGKDANGFSNQFSGYSTISNVGTNSFKGYRTTDFRSYSLQSNVQGNDFATYSSDTSGDIQGFSSYSEESNVVKNDFKTYGKDANGFLNQFSGYSTSSNVGTNSFKGYDSDSNSPLETFSGYGEQASQSDNQFRSYGKGTNELRATFASYGNSTVSSRNEFVEYNKDAAGIPLVQFSTYVGNQTSFKQYVGTPGTFSEYLNTSSATSATVEPGKFFRQANLAAGERIPMPDIRDKMPSRSFLPRVLADKLPFSSARLPELVGTLGAADLRGIMAKTLAECERPAVKDETKRCVTSLEGMVEFAVSVLGKSAKVSTTASTAGWGKTLVVGKVVPRHGGRETKSVSCHQSLFPYLVYYCHAVPRVAVYDVELMEKVGGEVVNNGVAICHLDTSQWSAGHAAFVVLGPAPGKIEVCHWIFENDLIWVARAS